MPRPRKEASTAPPPDLSEFESSSSKQTTGVVDRSVGKVPKRRLSLPVTEAGLVDWESMRESTRTEAVQVLSADPGVKALYQPIEPVEKFDDAAAAAVLDAFAAVKRVVYAKLLHFDPQVAHVVFTYSPEMHVQLDPALCAVANKYADKLPTWLVRYREEFTLLMMMGKIEVQQLKTATYAQRNLNAQRQAAASGRRSGGAGPVPVYQQEPERSEQTI